MHSLALQVVVSWFWVEQPNVKSSLVKVSKDPSSQRAGLLPLASSSPSCQCPGSLQPFPCVPKHPLSWSGALAQQRASAEGISRDVKRQLGGKKAPGAIWYLWQAAAPL